MNIHIEHGIVFSNGSSMTPQDHERIRRSWQQIQYGWQQSVTITFTFEPTSPPPYIESTARRLPLPGEEPTA